MQEERISEAQVLQRFGMEDEMIEQKRMEEVYHALQTPFKVGMILEEEGAYMDCPCVFRTASGEWGMVYAKYEERKNGYETWYAVSRDLLNWKEEKNLLAMSGKGWDAYQCAGGMALIDPEWEGTHRVASFQGKYWMSYIGGQLQGYEPDPLSIGMAYSREPEMQNWERLPEPILMPMDPQARKFEKATLYKSTVIEDKRGLTGYRFVMFYNAKQEGIWVERIGMAGSNDMICWSRIGDAPVIDNGIDQEFNISGDPQLLRYDDLWVMNYFVCREGKAFDTFACSKDLFHWTKWNGEPLIEAGEDYDKTYAHKPWILMENGRVYHFYCAVSGNRRGLALAVSRP